MIGGLYRIYYQANTKEIHSIFVDCRTLTVHDKQNTIYADDTELHIIGKLLEIVKYNVKNMYRASIWKSDTNI